jgi:hypothetical protein
MGIETKTVAQIVDELSIANGLCMMAQENGPTRNLERAQKLNKRRSALVAALDVQLEALIVEIIKRGGKPRDASLDEKTYT